MAMRGQQRTQQFLRGAGRFDIAVFGQRGGIAERDRGVVRALAQQLFVACLRGRAQAAAVLVLGLRQLDPVKLRIGLCQLLEFLAGLPALSGQAQRQRM